MEAEQTELFDPEDDSPDAPVVENLEPPWMGKRRIEVPNYSPVAVLMEKLERWLLMQPEWAVILAAPRATRRSAVQLISKRLVTTPTRHENFGGMYDAD